MKKKNKHILKILLIFLVLLLLINRKSIYNFATNIATETNFRIVKSKQSLYSSYKNYKRKIDYINNLKNVLKTIDRLYAELEMFKLNDMKYLNIEKENRELRNYFNLRKKHNYDFKVANVFLVESLQNSDTIYIDKGLKDNIEKYQLVIYNGNIIGRVNNVAQEYSEVYLLSNPNLKLSVTINNDFTGVLRGKGSKKFAINQFDTDLIENTNYFNIKTSGISKLYPKNLPIGVFRKIDDKNQELNFKLNFLPESINTVIVSENDIEKMTFINKIEQDNQE